MSSIKTKFVDYKQGPPQNLFVNQRQLKYDSNSYLMKIKAVGINRAQCLHRVGRYPINNQVQKYIGLQAAGQVINHQTGQKLFDGMALLSGGSYSQYAVIPKTHVMKTPKGLNFVESSAIPQAWLTAFLLIRLAQLQKGSTVVIYAGASGVGTAAIQICRVLGLIPFAVVSNQAKGKVTIQCGVQNVVYYKQNQNWAKQLLQKNNNKGFNAVLDCIGPSNADKTLQLLGIDGKWIFYGTLSGIKGQLNYAQLIGKRISLISSTLKTRSKQYKDKLIQQFLQKILPSFQNKKVKPVIGQKLQCNWQSAQSFIKAHQIMQSNANSGKIIIQFK